METTPSAM